MSARKTNERISVTSRVTVYIHTHGSDSEPDHQIVMHEIPRPGDRIRITQSEDNLFPEYEVLHIVHLCDPETDTHVVAAHCKKLVTARY